MPAVGPLRVSGAVHACTLALALGPACGDAAADGDYAGDPVLSIAVGVTWGSAGAFVDPQAPRMALVWIADDDGGIAEVEADVAIDDRAGTLVTLRLLEPPAATRTAAKASGTFALGQVAMYDDLDGDGAWSAKAEPLLGVSNDLVVVYTASGVEGGVFAPLGALAPGFHLVAPNPCPSEARFAGEATAGSIVGTAKGGVFFQLACAPATSPPWCLPLELTRYYCRRDAASLACTDCPDAAFPRGADEAACDAWRAVCDAAYPDVVEQCASEHAVCVAGEPPCDVACLCQHLYDACLAIAERAVCDAKHAACLE